jgi:Asp-tRNA(Asn)/Glu-tRNA(Gln) amidotransferase B subunit
MIEGYGLTENEADLLIKADLGDYFEVCVWCSRRPTYLALWLVTQLEKLPMNVESFPLDYYNQYESYLPNPNQVAKFILNELRSETKGKDINLIPPQYAIILLTMRNAGKLNNMAIKKMIREHLVDYEKRVDKV